MTRLNITAAITTPVVTVAFDGRGAPVADVLLADDVIITARVPSEAYALRDAFQKAGDLLAAAEPHQPQAGDPS